ncbi:MAG: hypothetical protein AB1806_13975 [Acidobacteriota bacterium]
MRERVFRLVLFEPFEDALPSLGQVLAVLLLANSDDPVAAVDEFARIVKQTIVDAKAREEGRQPWLH